MKKLRLKIYSLIIAVFVAAFTVGTAFGWFTPQFWNLEIAGASKGAYFKGGMGTSDAPYTLDSYNHLYNLAWLQNTGRLQDKQYYFKIELDDKATLDMTDNYGATVIIPPIGNADYPFKGVFDGAGATITNLIVSTNKDVLYGNPASESYKFSNAVGLFGMTTEDSEIRNFILNNPVVEVADKNNDYSTDDIGHKAVGLAIGSVNGKASSIGVIGGTLAVRRTSYTTVNSILGEMSESANNDNNLTGGGGLGSGGSGSSFGGTLDVVSLTERLDKIYQGKYGAEYKKSASLPPLNNLLPEINTSSSIPVPELGYKVPFAVLSEDATNGSVYAGNNAKENEAPNNIGYIMGNQNKISSFKMNYVDTLMQEEDGDWFLYKDADGNKVYPDSNHVPRWFYQEKDGWKDGSGYLTQNGFAPISQEKYNSLPENVQNVLQTTNFDIIRIQAQYNQWDTAPVSSLKYDALTWGYHGQISWMGNTYGDGFNKNGYLASENGDWYDGTNVQENNQSVWIKSGHFIDEEGFLFSYDDEKNKDYAAGPDVPGQTFYIESDGRIRYTWADWYFKNAEGDDFIIFGDYHLNDDDQIVDSQDNPIYIYDAWGNKINTAPLQGTKIPSYANTDGVALPNNGIWFKPSKAGTIRLIMFAKNDGEGFILLKAKRDGADAKNPFYVEDGGSNISLTKVRQQSLPKYVLYYFEFDVSEDEIYDTEYIIMIDNDKSNNGAYFLYLDLGASAADEDDDTSQADPSKQVTAVDFIYGNVRITQQDITSGSKTIPAGSFVVNDVAYVETGTMLSFGGNGALVYFYYRDEDGSVLYVGYNGNNTPKSSIEGRANAVAGLADKPITKQSKTADFVWIPS